MSAPPDPIAPGRPAPERRWLKPLIAVVLVALVVVIAWVVWSRHDASNGQQGATSADGTGGKAGGKGSGKGAGKGGRGGNPNQAQPVAVAAAKLGNVDVVQTALGTVNALRTVTVHPRVDGQLNAVSFNEGQLVPAGFVLAQIDPAPFEVAVEQAQGQLDRDLAQLANARLDLQRYQTLIAQDSIPKQQVDQQAALVKQLEGTVKMDKGNLDNAKLQLSYTRIVAPIAGRTGLRQVDPGNIVHQTDANGIVVITQVDPITVLYTIPQDALPRVLERMRANDKPAVQALDRDLKTVLASGSLLTTDNVIDVTTGTVKLKAQLPNSNGKLFPNQFVNVRMVVDTHRNVITVPTAAVQLGAQGPVVYVVKSDSTVEVRNVKTGAAEGGATEITSGLQQGERVITDGVDRIREGSKVEVVQPGAPGGGGRGGNRGQGQTGKAPGSDGPGGTTPAGKSPGNTGNTPPASPPAGTPAPGAGPSSAQDTGTSQPGNMKGAASTDPNAPANNGDDARREAYKKRLESMTPEQRAEFEKRRQQRQQQQSQGQGSQ
jgi:multidrug efflux system membrane fusion protein